MFEGVRRRESEEDCARTVPDPLASLPGDSPLRPRIDGRESAYLLALGLVSGVLGGLLGIGGGAVVVPGLVLLLGFGQHRAHGTSLAIVLFMSVAGALAYSRFGNMDWRLSTETAAGGVAGAWLGGRVVGRLRGATLRRLFSAFLLVVGVRVIVAGLALRQPGATVPPEPGWLDSTLLGSVVAVGVGLVTGFLSSILGIGGGMVLVPALAILLHVPQKMAQGVSLAVIIPTALAGMLLHRRMGNVVKRAAVWVGTGGLVGAVLGAELAHVLRSGTLMLVFGAFLVVMSAILAFRRNGRE